MDQHLSILNGCTAASWRAYTGLTQQVPDLQFRFCPVHDRFEHRAGADWAIDDPEIQGWDATH